MENAITNPKTKIHPSCVPLYILKRARKCLQLCPKGVGHRHRSLNEVSMLLIHPILASS